MKGCILLLTVLVVFAHTQPLKPSLNEVVRELQLIYPKANYTLVQAAAREYLDLLDSPSSPAVVEDIIDCPPLSPRDPPRDIEDLHPQDVHVVAAIGDSMTVGTNALSTSWLNLQSYPGLSWSMGGDDGRITMPNLLKQFSKRLRGMSFGSGLGRMNFNFAVDGAMARDMPGQARRLVDALHADPEVDWDNDWKIVTVLVGGNDLCKVCESDAHTPEIYEHHLRETFKILETMPRTYVSVMSALQYTQIHQWVGPFCRLALDQFCPCIPSNDKATRDYVDKVNAQYNDVIHKIYQDYRKNHGIDFGVVYQPFQEETDIPSKEYLSTADCFHPSGEGHRLFAKGLWNNMISPVAKKDTRVDVDTTYLCPTDDTLLYID